MENFYNYHHFENHYHLGLYIKNIMLSSQITDLEINIISYENDGQIDTIENTCKMELYISLAGADGKTHKIIDWKETPQDFISIHHFDDINLNFTSSHMNYFQFIENMQQKLPFLLDQSFLNYLLHHLILDKTDNAIIGFHRFHIHSLSKNLKEFFSNGVASYFLCKKLNNTMNHNDFLNDDTKTKI